MEKIGGISLKSKISLIVRIIPIISVVTALGLCAYKVDFSKIEAYDFAGNETYWTNYCSGIITETSKQEACRQYSDYISNKIDDSQNNLDNITSSIDSVKSDLSNLREVSEQYTSAISNAEAEIEAINNSLAAMEGNVESLNISIAETVVKIDSRKEIIRQRMIEMQPSVNTNQFIQYIMGATDLVDLVQRANSIEAFTKNDKEQIKTLNKEQADLKNQQDEQARISATLELQRENLSIKQKELEALKISNDQLIADMEVKLAELARQKNEAAMAAGNLSTLKPSFTIDSSGNADIGDIVTGGMIAPISGCSISRGVSYEHLGVDYAANSGTPIVAPADCYVVYACNGFGNGYLGNWQGPGNGAPGPVAFGGGNTVSIIFNVNGVVYGMNAYHCSSVSGIAVSANGSGTVVGQGSVIAYVGSSGNSSGPHAHIELFVYNTSSIQQAVGWWYNNPDFQRGCGWGPTTPASSSWATRVDPLAYF